MTRPTSRPRRLAALAFVVANTLVGSLVPAGPPAAGATSGSPTPVRLRLAQANLKVTMPSSAYAADLATVVARHPDLVSLNEVSRRTEAQLSPAGYDHFMPREQENGNVVLWRRDRWALIDGGVVTLTDSGPRRFDAGRQATWTVLRSTGSTGTLAMVSTHMMENPATIGPDKPLRRRIYAEGMRRLSRLVATLSSRGPVFVAGDFNSQFRRNDPWGPRRALAGVGLVAAMQKLGAAPTHDGGGIIDYVFYQPRAARPTAQRITGLRSDHKLVVDDLVLTGAGRATSSTGR